jgi:cysteine desulfuration protein SufE
MTLENILANFQLLDDWEDRYRYVIELGRALPPLPEAARTEANRVRGCASQVWLATEVNGATDGAAPCLIFKGDSDAHIVRGLIAILFAIYSGRCADEILRTERVPAPRIGRALDAAALEWIRLDGRAHLHRLPPRRERRGETV